MTSLREIRELAVEVEAFNRSKGETRLNECKLAEATLNLCDLVEELRARNEKLVMALGRVEMAATHNIPPNTMIASIAKQALEDNK